MGETDPAAPDSEEEPEMLRTNDAFRDFDRLTQQLLGATSRTTTMPVDAWREGDRLVLELDLPGVRPDSIDVDVERNVLTVRAERVRSNGEWQLLAGERAHGTFSRQLVLGDNLDPERIEATYDVGVLRLVVPVAEKAKPRRIDVAVGDGQAASTGHEERTAIRG